MLVVDACQAAGGQSCSKWQAYSWREAWEAASRMGRLVVQRSSGLAACLAHLGWKGQPVGGLSGEGTSPVSTMRSRVASVSGLGSGMAERRHTASVTFLHFSERLALGLRQVLRVYRIRC